MYHIKIQIKMDLKKRKHYINSNQCHKYNNHLYKLYQIIHLSKPNPTTTTTNYLLYDIYKHNYYYFITNSIS